ncbi:GPW/gp25 family protein [Streptomyces sp. NPDC093223]|uniref:GPW/gp25 family protein n=1 Tax=Streptomyces sp. NPDC093223 TaxID=3366033 RepID=UPI0037FF7AD9
MPDTTDLTVKGTDRRGWRFPLGVGGTGAMRTVEGPALLEQSMRLILTTYPGERRMRPHFGSRLRDFVFAGTDPDTLDRMSREVRASLSRCEPGVVIHEVRAEPDPAEPTLVNITVVYAAAGAEGGHQIVVPFSTEPHETDDQPDSGA